MANVRQFLLSHVWSGSIGRIALRVSDSLLHPSYREQDLLASYRPRVTAIILFLICCSTSGAAITRFFIPGELTGLIPLVLYMALSGISLGLIRYSRVSPFTIMTTLAVASEVIRFGAVIYMNKGTGAPEHIFFALGIVFVFLLLDRRRALFLSLLFTLLHVLARWVEHQRTGQVWMFEPAAFKVQASVIVLLVSSFTVLCLYCYEFFYTLTMERYQQEQDRNIFLHKMEDLADLAFNFYMQSKPYMLELRGLHQDINEQLTQGPAPEGLQHVVERLGGKCQQLAQISRSFTHFSHSAFSGELAAVDLKDVLQHVETILGISLAEYESSLSVHLPWDLHQIHSRQSQLVMLISLVIQHEIKNNGCEIKMTAENAGDDRVSLNIVSRPLTAGPQIEKTDQLLLETFLALIKDLCKQTACEAVMKVMPDGMSYNLSAKTSRATATVF